MRLPIATLSVALLFALASVVGALSIPFLFAVISLRVLWWARFG